MLYMHTVLKLLIGNRSITNSYIANQGQVKNVIVVSAYSSIRVKGSVTALLESLTALLEYLDLLQCLKITVLGHVHLSACNINNSPHKLGFQFSMRAGDQKLRFDLVWPNEIDNK